MLISICLSHAAHQLEHISPTARIDAEILLEHAMSCERSYFYGHGDEQLTEDQLVQFNALLTRRKLGEPMAYIIGHREFWSHDFKVTAATLIPRPETELLVELALDRLPKDAITMAELGTGTGALAISLALERPKWTINASDISAEALLVAMENAQTLKASNIDFYHGDWCKALPKRPYHAIIANPPYISEGDCHLHQGDLRFEPQQALISGEDGLDAIRLIITQATAYLVDGGWLMIEHGYDQAQPIQDLLKKAGYSAIQDCKDLAGVPRVAIAQFCS